MEMMQENVSETQVNEMLQLADLDKDGKINYEGNKNEQYLVNYRSIFVTLCGQFFGTWNQNIARKKMTNLQMFSIFT